MRRVKIIDGSYDKFNTGDIIEIYSKEEILNSNININNETKEWVAMNKYNFDGYYIDYMPAYDGTIDFRGIYKEEFELLQRSE